MFLYYSANTIPDIVINYISMPFFICMNKIRLD